MACLNLKWNHVFFLQWLLKYWGTPYAYFFGVSNQENHLHSCNFSHVKYFQMLEIQILPPLLFGTFPGYRGLQYVHNFLGFWVISNFFKCQKSQFSRYGLPVNSHANFTYPFPTLKIILIPTINRSNCFWFISNVQMACLNMKWNHVFFLQQLLKYWGIPYAYFLGVSKPKKSFAFL